MEILCGVTTKKGPCTMQKGHHVKWHRHIPRETVVRWKISSANSKQQPIAEGKNKQELQAAIARNLETHDSLYILVYLDRPS